MHDIVFTEHNCFPYIFINEAWLIIAVIHTNLSSCKIKAWKRKNPWPLWYQCSALPIELSSQLAIGSSLFCIDRFPSLNVFSYKRIQESLAVAELYSRRHYNKLRTLVVFFINQAKINIFFFIYIRNTWILLGVEK